MKQKIVINVGFNGEKKSRIKVMQAAVSVPGVESITFGGPEDSDDQIIVIGDGLDSVHLTSLLRKKVKFAELLSVSSVAEEEKVKKVTDQPAGVQSMVWPTNYQSAGVPLYYYRTVDPDNYRNETCSIM